MRIVFISMLLVALLTLSGCMGYQAPVIPPSGIFFEDTKAPISTNVDGTQMGAKSGSASSTSILWLFAFGDCSVNTAAKNGNIQTIRHADYGYKNILGVYQNFQTIVYGD